MMRLSGSWQGAEKWNARIKVGDRKEWPGRETEKQDISAGMYCQDWMLDAVIYTKIRAAKECDIAVNYNDGRANQRKKAGWPCCCIRFTGLCYAKSVGKKYRLCSQHRFAPFVWYIKDNIERQRKQWSGSEPAEMKGEKQIYIFFMLQLNVKIAL